MIASTSVMLEWADGLLGQAHVRVHQTTVGLDGPIAKN